MKPMYSVSIQNNAATDSMHIILKMNGALSMAIANEVLVNSQGDPQWFADQIAKGVVKELQTEVYKAALAHIEHVAKLPTEKTYYFNDFIWTSPDEEALQKASSWIPSSKIYTSNSANSTIDYYQNLVNATTSATSGIDEHSTVKQLKEVFPGLDHETPCPASECYLEKKSIKLSVLIPHLNDSSHNWSREKIADWLETLDININAKDLPEEE